MFNLAKVEDTKQLELPPIKEGEIYILKKDDTIVGYAIINQSSPNKVYFSILEKYRSNGYGNILFKLLKEKLKEKDYTSLTFTISRDNIPAQNIIVSQKGILVSNNSKGTTYTIYLK